MTKIVLEPPHSVEAEQSLLGGLMLDRTAVLEVGDLLLPEHFFRPDHQLIFEAILALSDMNQPCDPVTVSDRLQKINRLQEVGGLAYLGGLTRDTPGAGNARAYAEIVKERATRRQLILYGRELMALGQLGFEREELDHAQQSVLDITTEKVSQGFKAVHELWANYSDVVDARGARGTHLVGPSTGFSELDRFTLGLEPGTLWLVAARPSVGKTSLVCGMLERVALAGGAAGMFSLEMPKEQLFDRMTASLGLIDLRDVRSGQMTDDQWTRMTGVAKKLHGIPLYIDDTAGISIGEIRARARRLKHRLAQEGKKLVCIAVDYLQLVKGTGMNPNERVSSVSQGLKNLAKELGIAVLALSQLSRDVEKREDKKPVMSDLRDSGSLEQDADIILFLWRKDGIDQGVRPGNIAKNRNGETGDLVLGFEAKYTRFDSLDAQSSMSFWKGEEDARKPRKGKYVSPEDSAADRRAGGND
jgi:replicative DNA helicase